MDEQSFTDTLNERGITLSSQQLEQFETYYKTLIEWNEKINLTSITAKEAVYVKHFYDSITPRFYFPFASGMTVCDIGAGAGFPSLPLLISMPSLSVTIVDALKKRITFLEKLITELKLDNVELIHARAEDVGRNPTYREKFSVVTARAVARLSVLSELCLPLCKVGGTFIALKGADAQHELSDAKKAYTSIGGGEVKEHPFHLPMEAGERTIITIDKKKTTRKQYPRKAGVPAKNPL